MKAITLNFKDKEGNVTETYSKTDILAGQADKILELEDSIEKVKGENYSTAAVREYFINMKAILVEIYDNQFTIEALNNAVSQSEMKTCFYAWYKHIIKN